MQSPTSVPDLPDEQWGIVSLADGSEVAGYVHVEADGHAVEVDVPGVSDSPANIVVVARDAIRAAKSCSTADVLKFVEHHRWPVLPTCYGVLCGAEHEAAD
jgi:hypothetical protein